MIHSKWQPGESTQEFLNQERTPSHFIVVILCIIKVPKCILCKE